MRKVTVGKEVQIGAGPESGTTMKVEVFFVTPGLPDGWECSRET